MKHGTKCDKCTEANASVYFSVISGKGKVSKKQYCRACATAERLKITANEAEAQNLPPTTALGMVQNIMEKSISAGPVVDDTPAGKIKSLEKDMAKAVANEDYERAAKIRDQIAVIKQTK